MIIQQRLDESAYNVRYDEIHNAFIISVIPSSLLDATLSDEAIKSIILEIDTEAANKLKKAENDFVGYLKGAKSWMTLTSGLKSENSMSCTPIACSTIKSLRKQHIAITDRNT